MNCRFNTRLSNVKVYAQASKPSPISVLRKKLEAKRSSILKDNFNKLTMIATIDTKFFTETLTELDILHKDFFEKQMKKDVSDVSGVSGVSSESDVESGESDDDNIFLKN